MTPHRPCTWPTPSPADTARASRASPRPATQDPRRPHRPGRRPRRRRRWTMTTSTVTGTPKAPALRPGPDEWACEQCGAACFGTPPEDGLCPACRAGEDGR